MKDGKRAILRGLRRIAHALGWDGARNDPYETEKRRNERILASKIGARASALCALALALALGIPIPAKAQVHFGEQPPAQWEDADVFEWTIFDVNEGDAMLLRCGGESMLVDGGPAPFREDLRDALDELGLRRLTRLFNTHAHDDHIDGLYYLLTYGFTAEEYVHSYSPSAIEASELCNRTVEAAGKNGVPVRRVADGDTLTLGSAQLEVIQWTGILNANARSLVLKVTFGGSTALLCADIIGDTQHALAQSAPEGLLDADLIKLPHHAITAAVPEFLDAVSPEAAVVTNCESRAGDRAKKQLRCRNLPTLFSGAGRVSAVTDGTDWYVWQEKGKF